MLGACLRFGAWCLVLGENCFEQGANNRQETQNKEKKCRKGRRHSEVPERIMPGDVNRTFIDRAEVEDLEVLGVVQEEPEHIDEPVNRMLPEREPEEESRQRRDEKIQNHEFGIMNYGKKNFSFFIILHTSYFMIQM